MTTYSKLSKQAAGRQKPDPRKKKPKKRHWLSERLGTPVSVAGAALLGAGTGVLTSAVLQNSSPHHNALRGFAVGGGSALAAAALLSVAGRYTGARSREDQEAYENSSGQGLSNWLIPGWGEYNRQQSNIYDQAYDIEQEDALADRGPIAKQAATRDDPGWNPIKVDSPEYVEEAAAAPLYNKKQNLLVGLGIGALTGTGTYFLMRDKTPSKDPKIRRKRAIKTTLAALGVGLGTGAAAAGIMAAAASQRGTNFTHNYRLPDPKTDGEHPDIQIHFVGGGGSAEQDRKDAKNPNWDRVAFDYRNEDPKTGKGGAYRTYMINPNDTYYARALLREIHKRTPGARIHISGHSHGGASAYRLAREAEKMGIEIDQLDTIDPISTFTDIKGKPATTRLWNNYRPDKWVLAGGAKDGNTWAVRGGTHPSPEGSVDHVFKHDASPYGNHSDIRHVPFDFGNGEYKGYDVKTLPFKLIKRVADLQAAAEKREYDAAADKAEH